MTVPSDDRAGLAGCGNFASAGCQPAFPLQVRKTFSKPISSSGEDGQSAEIRRLKWELAVILLSAFIDPPLPFNVRIRDAILTCL